MPKASRIISRVRAVRRGAVRDHRSCCPHCSHRWTPKRTEKPKWCPRCHRLLVTEGKDKLQERREIPDLATINRFTPSAMKDLIDLRLYAYKGIPKNLVPLTHGRQIQRAANLEIADQFFRGDMNATDFADAMKLSRQGLWQRLEKGFSVMLERGCFMLTQKGRENIARSKSKIA